MTGRTNSQMHTTDFSGAEETTEDLVQDRKIQPEYTFPKQETFYVPLDILHYLSNQNLGSPAPPDLFVF